MACVTDHLRAALMELEMLEVSEAETSRKKAIIRQLQLALETRGEAPMEDHWHRRFVPPPIDD